TQGRLYFLSRPRRFGKSLLVSTLYAVLTARKTLFDGLWIASSDYTWQEHGVINLDFSKIDADSVDSVRYRLKDMILTVAHNYKIYIDSTIIAPDFLFEKLVNSLFEC